MQYRLVRSKRKSLAIEVTPSLEIIVRAPFFVSKRRIEKFVLDHQKWAEDAIEKIKERQKNRHPEPSEEQIKVLKQRAKEILPERVAHYSQIMGVLPSAVKITSARTRFGSCSGKNSICFSYRLMQYATEAIDYVVVHELAHIKYKNHGKQFYAFIEEYMPDYKEREKLLKNAPAFIEK